jgi:RNA polymerase sigma-70 factor (ECF subfamily)
MAADHTNSVIDRDQLERAFRRLTLKQRMVLVLHHYLDLSPREIADALDVPVGTIASRMHYALRAMRVAIDADAAPTPKEVAR